MRACSYMFFLSFSGISKILSCKLGACVCCRDNGTTYSSVYFSEVISSLHLFPASMGAGICLFSDRLTDSCLHSGDKIGKRQAVPGKQFIASAENIGVTPARRSLLQEQEYQGRTSPKVFSARNPPRNCTEVASRLHRISNGIKILTASSYYSRRANDLRAVPQPIITFVLQPFFHLKLCSIYFPPEVRHDLW